MRARTMILHKRMMMEKEIEKMMKRVSERKKVRNEIVTVQMMIDSTKYRQGCRLSDGWASYTISKGLKGECALVRIRTLDRIVKSELASQNYIICKPYSWPGIWIIPCTVFSLRHVEKSPPCSEGCNRTKRIGQKVYNIPIAIKEVKGHRGCTLLWNDSVRRVSYNILFRHRLVRTIQTCLLFPKSLRSYIPYYSSQFSIIIVLKCRW